MGDLLKQNPKPKTDKKYEKKKQTKHQKEKKKQILCWRTHAQIVKDHLTGLICGLTPKILMGLSVGIVKQPAD